MNDPHVVALLYRVEYSPFFTYGKVQPCAHELAGFRIRIESEQATVEPKQHFAAVEAAQKHHLPLWREATEDQDDLRSDGLDDISNLLIVEEQIAMPPQSG
jgi:hypothetical protein